MTRAPWPAGHEPDATGGSRAPGARSAGPPADDRETVVLPALSPTDAGRPAVPAVPAVPEVPAIADIAAPGRPDVDAVVAPEAPPARRRRRPSRHMRARADEMARALSRAAPAAAGRRGLSSLPAAVAVMGAVAVGGVGIALGLDAQQTGAQIALPGAPAVPAEQTPVPETGQSSVPTANTGVVEALEPDSSTREAEPSSVAASARRAPQPAAPPRATTPSARPRPTSTTARSTTPERSTTTSTRTPRSTTPRATPRADGGTSGGVPDGAAVGSRGLGDLDEDAAEPSSSSALDGGTTGAE